MEKLTVDNVLKRRHYEGIVCGTPTGMYADRESYGNAPMLAFILDERLPCKARARPYSQRYKAQEGKSEVREQRDFLEELTDKVINVEFDDENENLGVAPAFINQAMGKRSEIEVQGKYENRLFSVHYLKVENFGFEFPGYTFPFEKDDDE